MPGVISNGSSRLARACAASVRCSSLNASRFAKAAARRSAFEALAVMQRSVPPNIAREDGRIESCKSVRIEAVGIQIAKPHACGSTQQSTETKKCEAAEAVEALDPG